jgi:hypothetical protein
MSDRGVIGAPLELLRDLRPGKVERPAGSVSGVGDLLSESPHEQKMSTARPTGHLCLGRICGIAGP